MTFGERKYITTLQKEVVVKNVIKNNLYSSAVENGISRILLGLQEYLVQWIFKETLEKVTGLKSYTKNLKMITIR